MKTIGLLGGMSWESTVPYYRTINEVVAEQLGGLHSAKVLLHSFDFDTIEALQREERWTEAGDLLAKAAKGLEGAGADFIVICANTMHRVVPAIESVISIPVLHIADAAGERVVAANLKRVGLLGTRFSMEGDFIRGPLEDRYGLDVVTPTDADRGRVHAVIYDELCRGQALDTSRAQYVRIVSDLVDRGCEGVILGCTEIGMLRLDSDVRVPLFDTACIHAEAAARVALEDA